MWCINLAKVSKYDCSLPTKINKNNKVINQSARHIALLLLKVPFHVASAGDNGLLAPSYFQLQDKDPTIPAKVCYVDSQIFSFFSH
jgi:hypothetical protein